MHAVQFSSSFGSEIIAHSLRLWMTNTDPAVYAAFTNCSRCCETYRSHSREKPPPSIGIVKDITANIYYRVIKMKKSNAVLAASVQNFKQPVGVCALSETTSDVDEEGYIPQQK